MQPIPCAHCGNNFMRHTIDPEAPKLCNNCDIREQHRNPKKEKQMETIDILIKCPKDEYAKIEEYCINKGMNITQYFLIAVENLNALQSGISSVSGSYFEKEEIEEMIEKNAKSKTKGVKK